jgi:hypothetical protein
MASNYTGSPTGVQAPAVAPAPGVAPVISIPAGTDVRTIESITQQMKVEADYIAYLQKILQCGLPLTTSNVPQLRFLDAAGNGRYVIDHNGFPTGGRNTEFNENWLTVPPGATGSQWSTSLGAGAVLAVQNPSASYNSPYLRFTPSTSGGVTLYSLIYSGALIVSNTAAMSLVMEFEVGLNAAAAGIASNTTWFFGLDAGSDPGGADVSLAGLRKKYNAVNYDFLSGNGALQSVTAASVATPPTANTFPSDRIKIEIQGSASPYAAYQARFWVNEVAIGTVVAANLPGATGLRLLLGSMNEGGVPAGAPLGYVGPIKAIWNRYASGPNL